MTTTTTAKTPATGPDSVPYVPTPFWSVENPWHEAAVYVPIHELAAACRTSALPTVAAVLTHWGQYIKGRGGDAYILRPGRLTTLISCGVRYGEAESDYLSPWADESDLRRLLLAYGGPDADTREPQDHGRQNALAWFGSIVAMVDAMRATMPDYDVIGAEQAHEDALQRITESVLSVEVRSGWTTLEEWSRMPINPSEYRILLSTGGPAAQIVGELDEHGQPESARLEFQDWFKPWTPIPLLDLCLIADSSVPVGSVSGDALEKVREYLLDFARCFYFGEG